MVDEMSELHDHIASQVEAAFEAGDVKLAAFWLMRSASSEIEREKEAGDPCSSTMEPRAGLW
jgi:phage shock protein A